MERDSVRKTPRDEFLAGECPPELGLRSHISKKKRFTMLEGIQIYKALGKYKTRSMSAAIWRGFERQALLPDRSIDRVKVFWAAHENKNLETYLCECIHNNVEYCLSFQEVPNGHILERKLREQYSHVFEQLEST